MDPIQNLLTTQRACAIIKRINPIQEIGFAASPLKLDTKNKNAVMITKKGREKQLDRTKGDL